MATGDLGWWASRIAGLLPAGWFADVDPVRDAIVSGISTMGVQGYNDAQFMASQTTVGQASSTYLDMWSAELLGPGTLPRRAGESDAAYAPRIQAELLRELGTLSAMENVIYARTGYWPTVFEPLNMGVCADCSAVCDVGLGVGGTVPFEAFIDVILPTGPGFQIGGLDCTAADVSLVCGDASTFSSTVTEAEIMTAVLLTAPAGVTPWTRFWVGAIGGGIPLPPA